MQHGVCRVLVDAIVCERKLNRPVVVHDVDGSRVRETNLAVHATDQADLHRLHGFLGAVIHRRDGDARGVRPGGDGDLIPERCVIRAAAGRAGQCVNHGDGAIGRAGAREGELPGDRARLTGQRRGRGHSHDVCVVITNGQGEGAIRAQEGVGRHRRDVGPDDDVVAADEIGGNQLGIKQRDDQRARGLHVGPVEHDHVQVGHDRNGPRIVGRSVGREGEIARAGERVVHVLHRAAAGDAPFHDGGGARVRGRHAGPHRHMDEADRLQHAHTLEHEADGLPV